MAWYADKLIYDTGSGGDYEDLAAFEAAYDGEDISATDGVRARIKGATTDGTIVYWDNWQAGQDADCKIVITAETGYGLQDRTDWKGADGSGTDAVISDIQAIEEATNPICMDIYNLDANFIGFGSDGNNNILRVWNCLLRDSSVHGIEIVSCGTTTVYLANLLIRDYSTSSWKYGIGISDADVTAYGWNITIDTGEYGVYETYGSIEARNIVVINTDNSTFASMSDENYCAADDASPGGVNSIDSITIANEFTDAAGEDYTVKSTDSQIYHAGADQPAWFDTLTGGKDIRGVSWHATTPSIGCFEYVAAAGWTGKICGVTNPSKICGIAVADITKVCGVS